MQHRKPRALNRAASVCLLALAYFTFGGPVGCGSTGAESTTGKVAGAGGAGGEDCWWCAEGGSSAMTGSEKSTSSTGGKDAGSGGKGGDAPNCPADFDPKAMCEGGPKDNYCIFNGKLYYCENGSWQEYNGGK